MHTTAEGGEGRYQWVYPAASVARDRQHGRKRLKPTLKYSVASTDREKCVKGGAGV